MRCAGLPTGQCGWALPLERTLPAWQPPRCKQPHLTHLPVLTCAGDAHRLQHATRPQLLQHVGRRQVAGLAVGVGLDAAGREGGYVANGQRERGAVE